MKAVLCACSFIAFDVVTGLVKALYCRNFNSSVMREGGFHKLSELLALFAAYGMEFAAGYINIGFDVPAVGVVSVYLCIMEFISISENLSEVNPQMREMFKPYLEKLKRGENNEIERR